MNNIRTSVNWSENEKGVTMIEILMAICILAVGILAVVAMQTGSLRGNTTSLSSTDALIFAVGQMENLMGQTWGSTALDSANNPQQVTSAGGQYTATWNVTNNNVFQDTKTINMTVDWSKWGLQKQISLQHVMPRII